MDNKQNVGRKRSLSLPLQRNPNDMMPKDYSPKTHVGEHTMPVQFTSVLRNGLIPGGGENALLSADKRVNKAIYVQRMPQNPSQVILDSAMKDKHQGIMGITSERSHMPLETEQRITQIPNTDFRITDQLLSSKGIKEAEKRMKFSMLLSFNPPTPGPVSQLSEEERNQTVHPKQFTGISVPFQLLPQAQRMADKLGLGDVPMIGAHFDTIPTTLRGSNIVQDFRSPDYRPVMQQFTSHGAQDMHVVRADPPEFRVRLRSKSLPQKPF